MRIRGQKHVYKLKRATRLLVGGKRQQLTLKLWSNGMRALRAALKHHHKVTATLNATARDAARNRKSGALFLRAVR